MKKIIHKILKNRQTIIDILIFIAIIVFLFSYFKPSLIFSVTTTNGGDTPSHITTAKYLKEYLLPQFRVVGWWQGAYAGMPLLQYYFPLPFLLIAFLSYLIPFEVSFKIITILGTFLLPICAYFCFRLMKFKFPAPIIAAIFTLVFLFNESNSMWGGNIPSTLAGEFSYSLGLSLGILYFGFLYKGINSKKYLILNTLLIFITGLCHVYTLLLVIFGSAFFLLSKKNFANNFKYLFKIFLLAFLLLGFWALPLYFKLGYTTSYALKWHFQSYREILPIILIPFLIVAIAGYAYVRIKKKETERYDYFIFTILISLIFFAAAYYIGVVDIRFLPFVQLFVIFMSVISLNQFIEKLRLRILIPFILLIATLLWVNYNVAFIDQWIRWNYSGFEFKTPWHTYNEINSYLSGSVSDPRVVYEHSMKHNQFGTSRAFEMLPYFSGRSTLEGVYMQASLSAPFIFYIQSEISLQRSCPFPNYGCSKIDIKNGIKHLKMFNVKDFIIVSEEIKNQLKNFTNEFELKKQIDNYEIYELKSNSNRYIELLDYEPVLLETKYGRYISYLWFINEKVNDVHLVFVEKIKDEDLNYFKYTIKDESRLSFSKTLIDKNCSFDESVSEEEILINTTCIHKPLLVKISHHPNWKVEGAKKIYYASPSFMLIFPEQENVRIYYGKIFIDYFGLVLTILGVVILVFMLISKKKFYFKLKKLDSILELLNKHKYKILFIMILLLFIFIVLESKTNIIGNKEKFYAKEIAIATSSYPLCELSGAYRDKCFIEVAKKTYDYNLCTAKVRKTDAKDRCYKEVAIAFNDTNICNWIKDQNVMWECIAESKKFLK